MMRNLVFVGIVGCIQKPLSFLKIDFNHHSFNAIVTHEKRLDGISYRIYKSSYSPLELQSCLQRVPKPSIRNWAA